MGKKASFNYKYNPDIPDYDLTFGEEPLLDVDAGDVGHLKFDPDTLSKLSTEEGAPIDWRDYGKTSRYGEFIQDPHAGKDLLGDDEFWKSLNAGEKANILQNKKYRRIAARKYGHDLDRFHSVIGEDYKDLLDQDIKDQLSQDFKGLGTRVGEVKKGVHPLAKIVPTTFDLASYVAGERGLERARQAGQIHLTSPKYEGTTYNYNRRSPVEPLMHLLNAALSLRLPKTSDITANISAQHLADMSHNQLANKLGDKATEFSAQENIRATEAANKTAESNVKAMNETGADAAKAANQSQISNKKLDQLTKMKRAGLTANTLQEAAKKLRLAGMYNEQANMKRSTAEQRQALNKVTMLRDIYDRASAADRQQAWDDYKKALDEYNAIGSPSPLSYGEMEGNWAGQNHYTLSHRNGGKLIPRRK